MTFGTFISTRRKELKQNLRDTAKYLKIAYGYLSDIEQNRRRTCPTSRASPVWD